MGSSFFPCAMPSRALYAVGIFLILLLGYYVVAHGSWWFIKRYVHPLRGVFFTISGLYLAGLAGSLAVRVRKHHLFSLIIAALLSFTLIASVLQFVITWNDTTSNQMYPVAMWINKNLPRQATIGAFQSGTLGYFCPNVVNLDGKNNPYVLQRLLKGETIDYIREERFDYIIDWPSQIADYVSFSAFEKLYQPVAQVGASVVYKRRE
jgi:hypothetical protein